MELIEISQEEFRKLFPTMPTDKELLSEFNQIKAKCGLNETVGISYNYILYGHNSDGMKPNRKKAIKRIMRVLNLGYRDITQCGKCLYFRLKAIK